MAESLTRETKCVYVDTSLNTHLLVLLHHRETISDFKVKLCKEHLQCFPQLGEIDISAVKVIRQNTSGLFLDYHLPDSTLLSMVLDAIGHNCWSVFVDAAVKVEKSELPSENLELLPEKDKNDSLLEKDLEAGKVSEKTTKKRKLKVSDGKKKRKKLKDGLNQSATAAITAAEFDVDESHELRGNVQLEVVATRKETEKSVEEDVGRVNLETDNLVSHQENQLDTSSELTTRPDTEKKKKRKKKKSKDDINQSSAAPVTTSNVESVAVTPPESLPASGEENPFAEATQKEIEESVEAEAIDKAENQLDTGSGLTARPDTEKKSSEDDTNQTYATANVERGVDATPASLPISKGDNLDDSFAVVASQKGASPKVADSEVLSVEVNNAALEENPLMNNPQDTESDPSLLRKCSEVADDAEDKSLSKKILEEKADTGDNFGCSQNQESFMSGKLFFFGKLREQSRRWNK